MPQLDAYFRYKFNACLLSICMICNLANAQVFTETYNNLIRHFQDTVISLTSANNTIVHGIDNKVVIRNGLFKGNVNIQVDKKFILSREGNTFFLRAPDINSRENISLLIGDFKNDTIFYRTLRNEMLPAPSVYFGHVNLTDTKRIMLNDLQMADSVYLLFRHSLSGSSEWLKVKRFTIGYSYGSYYITHDNIGSIISQKIKTIMQGLKPGQELSISILAEGNGMLKKEVPLLYFRIQ